MGPQVLGQGWGEEAGGNKGIGKEDGESTVKEEYRRKEGRVAGKVVEMAKEWKEKEETQGEKSGGRKLKWGGERRGEGSGHSAVYVFLLKCLPCLFCKHRQGHDQNIETMK